MAAVLLLSLLLCLQPLLSTAQIASRCFEAGSCVDSPLVGYTKAIDSNHCLFDCQANANTTTYPCNWFTYYPDTGYCLQFQNCTRLQVTLDCPDCVSGEDPCRPVYECELENVQCQAVALKVTTSFSSTDCLAFCKETIGCEWFTFNRNDSYCVAFSDCMNRVPCASCLSGENDCEPQKNILYEKLFVAGGMNNASTSVEVLDLNGVYNCTRPRVLPVGLSGVFGVHIDDRILVCGGQTANATVVRDCYTYNATTNLWRTETFRLLSPRASAAAIQIDDNRWWVTGGTNDDSFYSSTEIFNAQTNTFTVGPVLPRPLAYHCLAQVDTNRFMVTGGASIGSLTTSSIYDFARNVWETKAPLPTGRYGHFCGTVVNEVSNVWNIDVVVSDGSQRNTNVYSTKNDNWTVGAIHPVDSSFGSSVAFGHSFLTFGGDSGNNAIYTYSSNLGGSWTDTRLKVQVPRQDSAAFLIPNGAYRCVGEPV